MFVNKILDRYVDLYLTDNEFGLKTLEEKEELKKLEIQISGALKLQELVKKRMKVENQGQRCVRCLGITLKSLQSLIEELEKQ